MELDDILSGKDPEPIEAPKEPAAAEPATPSKEGAVAQPAADPAPRGPDGKFAPKEGKAEVAPEPVKEPVKEPPKEEMTAKEKAFYRAAHEERQKRQALEQELARMRQQQQAPPQQAPAQQEQPKTFWDDPEGHLQRFQQNIQNDHIHTKLEMSEAIARTRYQDFDEKVAVFRDIVIANPAVAAEWQKSMDPATYAYNLGKTVLDRKQWEEAGGAEGIRKQVEAEVRAKVEKEIKDKDEARKKEADKLPGSLSEVSGRGNSAPTWTGPPSLDSVLKH